MPDVPPEVEKLDRLMQEAKSQEEQFAESPDLEKLYGAQFRLLKAEIEKRAANILKVEDSK